MTAGPPPSGLRSALRHESDKQAWVDWVFSRVAGRYDLGNDIMSLGWHARWKQRLVDLADLRAGDRVLDLACGTADITALVADRVAPATVVGSDINPEMLTLGRHKVGAPNVRWVGADAGRLPFAEGSFDVVTCAYAGRGFPDWPAVLHEVHRVLAPGGRFLNLDFARPPFAPWDIAYRAVMTVNGVFLGIALHGNWKTYVYIPESLKAYPGQRWLDAQMREAGFDTRLIETTGWLMAYNLGTKLP